MEILTRLSVLFLALGLCAAQAQSSSVCATATILVPFISKTSCVPLPTSTSTSTTTSTKTKTVAPPCSVRSAQLYLDPTPGAQCTSSFSAQKRLEVTPGQCVNVASSSFAGLTPGNFFELVGNDALEGEKCFVNLFDTTDCKGGAKFSYGSRVADADGSLGFSCTRFAIAPNSNAPKAVVSFKYTCGCANVESAKMLFAKRGGEGMSFVA